MHFICLSTDYPLAFLYIDIQMPRKLLHRKNCHQTVDSCYRCLYLTPPWHIFKRARLPPVLISCLYLLNTIFMLLRSSVLS
jgi:hypothetical protein